MITDWNPLLRHEFEQPYWKSLQSFVALERQHHSVYPPQADVFAALHRTSHAETKVVVLGQDPYHGPGQAHGLCFSVQRGVRPPPSLVNIFKELHSDLDVPVPHHGDLSAWARRGVLLLNTTLTVRAGVAGSHQGKGWETFTDQVIRAVNDKPFVVFVLWGAHARRKKDLIDVTRHAVIEAPHPSPLSAHQGFFGSRPFSRINAALGDAGLPHVEWSLD
jgi:uracil-DNA glycosylase